MGDAMKRILLAGATLLALTAAQPTLAADAPVYRGPAPYAAALFNWSGFYLGINGGYGWGNSRFDYVPVGTTTGNYNISGGLIGGTIGWNWQAPGSAIVFGIEGDLDWANIRGSALCPNPAFSCDTNVNWLGTIRGRLGLAMDRMLLFATAGAAFAGVQANVPTFGGASGTQTGWTAGLGIEAAVAGNWSVKAEYLYVNLGNFACPIGVCGLSVANVPITSNLLRVGANVRF